MASKGKEKLEIGEAPTSTGGMKLTSKGRARMPKGLFPSSKRAGTGHGHASAAQIKAAKANILKAVGVMAQIREEEGYVDWQKITVNRDTAIEYFKRKREVAKGYRLWKLQQPGVKEARKENRKRWLEGAGAAYLANVAKPQNIYRHNAYVKALYA